MTRAFLFATVMFLFASCSKELERNMPETRNISYHNLQDFELDYDHDLRLDLDKDGTEDFNFYVSDDFNRKKLEFRVRTLNGALLIAGNLFPKVFESNEPLELDADSKLTWTPNNAYLAYWMDDDAAPGSWDGAWSNHKNKFLAVKTKRANSYYMGWIRISAGTGQSKLIIHDYAINKTADATLKAGAKD